MTCLVDVHLPRRLVLHLRTAGHDALHTLDLPLQNRTPDEVVNPLSLDEGRIVAAFEDHTYVEPGRQHLTIHL